MKVKILIVFHMIE